MSMLCTLSRVDEAQIGAMRADPSLVDQLLHDSAPPTSARPGFLARLFGKKPPAPQSRTAAWIGAEHQLDLDRQWHILHFLLTGTSEGGVFPASFLCVEGEEIGEDFGYGRPRLFTAEQAGKIADQLEALSEADLLARYDAGRIEELGIYWQAAQSGEALREQVRWLQSTMREVAHCARLAAQRTCGLVVEIY